MLYEYSLTVPANTPESAPATLETVPQRGIVTAIDIQFPPGPAGMVFVRIKRAHQHVWPLNTEGYVTGDNTTVHWEGEYRIETAPTFLTIEGWSPGTTYDHTIQVRITMRNLPTARIRASVTPEQIAAARAQAAQRPRGV